MCDNEVKTHDFILVVMLYIYLLTINLSQKKNLVCDKGLYGYDCKETCGYCRDVNQCSNLNGTCLTGCVAGFKKGLCKTCKYYIDVCYCKMILVIQNTFHLNECYHSNLSYHHNSHTIVHVDKLHFFFVFIETCYE